MMEKVPLHFVFILMFVLSCSMSVASLECADGLFKYYNGTASEATVKFSVVMSLRRPGEGMKCGPIVEPQLQVLAAIQWTVERINDGGLLPFVQLGYEVFDDCGMPWYTAQGIQDMYGCHSPTSRVGCVTSNHEICSDIGLLAFTRSIADADIQDFTYKSDIPVLSPFLTGPDISPNIRKTRTNNQEQEQILIPLLKELGWTYVIAVHTADGRGQSTVQRLKDLARNESICVDVIGSPPFAFDKNESTGISMIIDKVWEARRAAGTSTLGVIFYGPGYACSMFSKALKDKGQSSGENNPIQLILTEECSEWTSELIANSAITDNTIMIHPKIEYVKELQERWATNFTKNSNLSAPSTPLEEAINEFYEETGRMPSEIANETTNPLITETVDSVFVLAVAYLRAQKQKCGDLNPTIYCDALKKLSRAEMIGYIKGVQETYDKLPGQAAPAEFVTAHRPIGHTQGMEVVMVNKSGNNLHTQKIASSDERGFYFYLAYVQLPKSICHGACLSCSSPVPFQYAYVPGDILLIGVFPIHSAKLGSPFECGEYKGNQIHRILPEAFFYGLKKMRDRTGIAFGGIALDSCESAPQTIRTMTDFMAGDVKLSSPGTSSYVDPKKARIVLGGFNSGVTVPLTMLLTNLGIPVVSYAASSPDLDDRLNFPYFLRSVPSDVEQAKAMVSVIQEMKWEYVSVLYVDNNYGTKGKQAFIDIATEAGICVTQPPLALSQVQKENEDNDVLTLLRNQKPEVVVLFVIEERVAQFLHNQQRQFERIGQSDNIVYLASEDWGQSQHVLQEGKTRTLGSITLRLESSNSADKASFADYMTGKNLATQTDYNPFFNELWANEFQCSPYPTCTESLRIPGSAASEWENNQRIVHTLNAMYAIGDGMKQERDKLCQGTDEFICQYFLDHPEIVTAAIQDARFFDSGKEFSVFGENGNGVTGFDVLNVQKDTDGTPHYVKIGSYSKGELILDRNKLTFYNGDVEAKCGQDHCQECKRQTGTSNNENGGTCGSLSTDDLQMRNIDTAIIVILSVVCVLLVVKTVYDTYRMRRNNGQPKIKKYASQISLANLQGQCSSESGNYSAGSLNYSGGSLQCSGGSLPKRPRYDKPPPPRRFVHGSNDDHNERYSETPRGMIMMPGEGPKMRDEKTEYLEPGKMRDAESHIYNTATIVCD